MRNDYIWVRQRRTEAGPYEDHIDQPRAYRQSLIAAFDSCPKRALFSLMDQRRTPAMIAAAGTLFHRFAHKALMEMVANGEPKLPVENGMEMLLEVCCQADVPSRDVVPITLNELRWLRVKVTKWCDEKFDLRRIMEVEHRLTKDIDLPTGVTRTVTGQMDVLIADPPDGIVVLDYKQGFKKPKEPKDEEGLYDGKGLTELGWVQANIYAYLVFHEYPSAERVVFREWHVLWGKKREVTILRWQAERMQDVLAAQVALLDQAVVEGANSPRWPASAGAHCTLCSMPRHCPIREQVGIPTTEAEARLVAQEWYVSFPLREDRRRLLDGWVDEHGPIEIPHSDGRRVIGWPYPDGPNGKKGSFGLFEPPELPANPYDEVLREAAGRAGVLKWLR